MSASTSTIAPSRVVKNELSSYGSDPAAMALSYHRKHELLQAKYNRLSAMNDRLRNRIYHIKKEIKCLKRLKRQLIQRLVHNGDRFVEPCLEIPDVEPGTSIDEKQHVEVARINPLTMPHVRQPPPSSPAQHMASPQVSVRKTHSPLVNNQQTKMRKPPITKAESRRRSEAMYKSLSDDARASVAGIIDEVITESRAERLRSTESSQSATTPVRTSVDAVNNATFAPAQETESTPATEQLPEPSKDEPPPSEIDFSTLQQP